MKLPRYFSEEERMILIRPSAIEFAGDFPGFRLKDSGWSLRIANQQKWNEPVSLVLPGHRGIGHLQIRVVAGLHARLDLIHLSTSDQGAFALTIDLAEGATLSLTEIFAGSPAASLKIDRFATLAASSKLTIYTGSIGTAHVMMKDEWELLGEQSELETHLLGIAGDHDDWHAVQSIRHLSPFTTSSVTNLLISAGAATLIVDVTGAILKGNHHSVCHQNNRGIILDESGVISVEPKLLIDEYDVDAGHGCAIGQINADELYYLQTRGLSETAAKRLIVSGYSAPLLARLNNLGFAKQLNRRMEQKMKGADR